MGARFSIGRLWILALVLFVVAMVFMAVQQNEPEETRPPTATIFMLVASIVMGFAFLYSLYRTFRWGFSRRSSKPMTPDEPLAARVGDLERSIEQQRLSNRVAELERQLAEARRAQGGGAPNATTEETQK